MKSPKLPPIAAPDIKAGPEIISDFQRARRAEGRIWADGYTQTELDAAQETFGLTFPPDLIDLFLDRRPVQGWDWRYDQQKIRQMLEWPLKGLLFDVENGQLWWSEWGERPARPEERAEVLRALVGQAPKLVPLFAHRYLPSDPNEPGNPVFSIYQSDIIYYGANLADYFEQEFGGNRAQVSGPFKHIRFWSDFVEQAL